MEHLFTQLSELPRKEKLRIIEFLAASMANEEQNLSPKNDSGASRQMLTQMPLAKRHKILEQQADALLEHYNSDRAGH